MYDFEEKYYRQRMTDGIKLNKKQQEAFDYIVKGDNIFLTGPGGGGKSAVIKMFSKIYGPTKNIAITSTTGTSALLLGGTTLHSYLGIGLGKESVEILSENILAKSWIKKKWRDLEVLIIDEVSMLSPDLFDKLEEIARIVRKNKICFGGIQLVLSGDLCQLGCVETEKFVFESKSWEMCIRKVVYLTEIIRQSEIEFQDCLNEIRMGVVSDKSRKLLESRVGIDLTNSIGIKPTKIFPLNYMVDEINNKELNILSKEKDITVYEYEMDFEYYSNFKNKEMTIEKYRKNCVAPINLQLCVNAQVMLLVNMDLTMGLANGSRGIVTRFVDDKPVVKFLNGEERIIDYHIWEYKESNSKIMDIIQIPLKLAYAVSAHKAQGISLDLAEIDLSEVFCYGQAYISLSRVKKISGLSITKLNLNKIMAHPVAVKFYKNLET
jgi:ATP-dependent DNA helicase PIF1